MKYFHLKGIHPAIGLYNPFRRWNKKDIQFTVEFNDTCKYNIGTRDQKDWNKLFGVDFTPFTPANSPTSVMVAWRYYNDTFQLGLYTHTDNESRHLPTTVIDSSTGKFEGVLALTSPVVYICANDITTEGMQLNLQKKGRIINPWFGGSKTPPHNMNFKLNIS